MTTLALTPAQVPAVQRALTSTVEILETEARQREQRLGNDRHVEEEREEAALLQAALEQLAGDQSPAVSRPRTHEALAELDDEELRGLIAEADELLDTRWRESDRAGREVSRRYTSGVRR